MLKDLMILLKGIKKDKLESSAKLEPNKRSFWIMEHLFVGYK